MGREDACLWSRPWLRYLATLVLGAKSQLPEGEEALVLPPPPGDRQTAPAQHQQRWAPAQTDHRGRSRSRSRSQIPDNTHRHTHTDTHLDRPQPAHRGGEAAVGASRPHHQTHRQPRVELCRARRAPWPDQARPRPGACAAASLRCCCVAGVPVSTRASVNVCPSMSHVARPMSHIPPSHGRPCLTCLPAPCRAISSWICSISLSPSAPHRTRAP
jgi:hypothetical protein